MKAGNIMHTYPFHLSSCKDELEDIILEFWRKEGKNKERQWPVTYFLLSTYTHTHTHCLDKLLNLPGDWINTK